MLIGIGCSNIKISERTHGGLKVIAMLQVNEAKSDDMEAFRQGCPGLQAAPGIGALTGIRLSSWNTCLTGRRICSNMQFEIPKEIHGHPSFQP